MIKKLFTILFGLLVLTSLSHAETYKVYVGNTAGSPSDVYTRKIFEVVGTVTKDNFVVINKPGVDQLIAYQAFLEESKTNPNVIFSGGTATHAASYSVHPELKLDPLKDTKGVITVLKVHYHLVVNASSAVKTAADIKNSKLNIGSSNATSSKLIELANFGSGVQTIPYKADTDVVMALMQRTLDVGTVLSFNQLLKVHKDKLRIISSFEQLNAVGTVGYSVAKSFPDARVKELNRAIDFALHTPEIQSWFKDTMSSIPVGGSPAEYDRALVKFKTVLESK